MSATELAENIIELIEDTKTGLFQVTATLEAIKDICYEHLDEYEDEE